MRHCRGTRASLSLCKVLLTRSLYLLRPRLLERWPFAEQILGMCLKPNGMRGILRHYSGTRIKVIQVLCPFLPHCVIVSCGAGFEMLMNDLDRILSTVFLALG